MKYLNFKQYREYRIKKRKERENKMTDEDIKDLKKMKANEKLADRIFRSLQILDYAIAENEKIVASETRRWSADPKISDAQANDIKMKGRKLELMENLMTLV